jgi:hypothetical protein
MPPRPLADEEQLAVAMAERPGWVKAVWATPERRLLLSVGVLAVAAWMLISALSDPHEFFEHRRSAVGFVAAPLMVFMFGPQAVEAIGDLLRKRDSGPARERDSVPVFFRVGWWLDRRGLYLVGLYLVVMVALLVALID